jgi:hypothetical protein
MMNLRFELVQSIVVKNRCLAGPVYRIRASRVPLETCYIPHRPLESTTASFHHEPTFVYNRLGMERHSHTIQQVPALEYFWPTVPDHTSTITLIRKYIPGVPILASCRFVLDHHALVPLLNDNACLCYCFPHPIRSRGDMSRLHESVQGFTTKCHHPLSRVRKTKLSVEYPFDIEVFLTQNAAFDIPEKMENTDVMLSYRTGHLGLSIAVRKTGP